MIVKIEYLKFSSFYSIKKKKLHINPNQNSTKAIRVICDRKFKKYNTKKLNKKTINLNYSYKKEQKSRERERERERTHSFCMEKIWIESNK